MVNFFTFCFKNEFAKLANKSIFEHLLISKAVFPSINSSQTNAIERNTQKFSRGASPRTSLNTEDCSKPRFPNHQEKEKKKGAEEICIGDIRVK